MSSEKRNNDLLVVLLSSKSSGAVARASSVLQKNVKMYGPMNALNIDDGSSCWYSDGEEGATQSLTIHFGRQVLPLEIRIQFQAGFSAETCQIHARNNSNGSFELLETVEPDDAHELQTFPLKTIRETDAIKLVFDDFADFYGRVTVYRLGIYGNESEKQGEDESN